MANPFVVGQSILDGPDLLDDGRDSRDRESWTVLVVEPPGRPQPASQEGPMADAPREDALEDARRDFFFCRALAEALADGPRPARSLAHPGGL